MRYTEIVRPQERVGGMQNSDIVDVVGLTPVPSPAASTDPAGGEDESGRIRCVCGNEDDDGFTIQCESCLVWQHAVCVGIARNNVPEVYLCEECRPDDVDVESSSGGGSTVNSRRRRPTSSRETLPPLNEISENIISTEVQDELTELIQTEYEQARLRMPRLPKDLFLGNVNFEQCQMVLFPTLDDIRSGTKMVDVRELRVRSLGRRNTSGGAKLGVFAAEDVDPGAIIGEFVGQVQPISVLEKKGVESVFQSYVLITSLTPGLIVDARKFGNALRYVRRSCRPNCEIKLVFTEQGLSVHWCLFARNTIRENEELFLPFDYGEGNRYFRYECCCAYPELCLADDMPAIMTTMATTTSSVGSNSGSTTTIPPVASRKKPVEARKLSREERKLQQYIEFIERMESAEKKSGKRTTGAGGTTPPSPSGSSPKQGRKGSSLAITEQTGPSSSSSTSSPATVTARAQSLPTTPTKLPLKKMLSKTFGDRSRHASLADSPSKSDGGSSSFVPSPLKPTDEDTIVDVVNTTTSPPPAMMTTTTTTMMTSTISSTPETPSKKRVSLSDYLSRRKSSPADKAATLDINEVKPDPGIIMGDAEVTPTTDTTVPVMVKPDPGIIMGESSTPFFTPATPTPLAPAPFFSPPITSSTIPPFRYYTPPPLPTEEGECDGEERRGDSRKYPLFTDERWSERERDRKDHHHHHHRDRDRHRSSGNWKDRR